MQEEPDKEPRTNGQLSHEDIERIKEAVLASVYEDIGRSVVKKFLWVAGSVLAALLGWAYATGHIK